jgi:hypothetical protein
MSGRRHRRGRATLQVSRLAFLSDILLNLELVDDVVGLVKQYAQQPKLILVGGCYKTSKPPNEVDSANDIHCYDPSNNTWTVLEARWPNSTADVGVAMVNNHVHFISNYDGGHAMLSLETGSVTQLRGLYGGPYVSTVLAGELTVFVQDGLQDGVFVRGDNMWDFNLDIVPPSRRAEQPVRVATLGSHAYIIDYAGGMHHCDRGTGQWADCARLQPWRVGYTFTASDDDLQQLYVCGGTGECTRYCATTDEWRPMAKMHVPRSAAAAAFLDGQLIVCGGWCGDAVVYHTEAYDPKTDTWRLLAPMLRGRHHGHALVTVCECPVR